MPPQAYQCCIKGGILVNQKLSTCHAPRTLDQWHPVLFPLKGNCKCDENSNLMQTTSLVFCGPHPERLLRYSHEITWLHRPGNKQPQTQWLGLDMTMSMVKSLQNCHLPQSNVVNVLMTAKASFRTKNFRWCFGRFWLTWNLLT